MIGNKVSNKIERGFFVERKARDIGDLKKAASVLGKLQTILLEHPEDDVLPYWTRFYYETAHVAKLNGGVEKSCAAFEQNAIFAERCGDAANALNARYHYKLMQYLSGVIEPAVAYKYFLEVYGAIVEMQRNTERHSSTLEGMKQNLLSRLCDLSFENQSSDFSRWNTVYDEDPQTQIHRLQNEPRFDLVLLRNQGRTAYMNGKFDVAAAIFSSYLDVEHSKIPPQPQVRNLPAIAEFFREIAEETACDYRDAGRALMSSTLTGKKEGTLHIWHRGLKLTNDIGNRRYLNDIRKEINRIS